LVDPDTGQIKPEAVTTSVAALRALHAPSRDSLPQDARYGSTERTIYTLRVIIVGAKLESDSDYHVVVADPGHPRATMIVEFPNPRCTLACSSPHAAEYGRARAALIATVGHLSAHFKLFAPPHPATITGVGFLDYCHGQTGRAPNCVELHPVLTVSFP
jgi:hypothetical protein